MPVTTDQVLETLRPVEDPELHRSIVDLGMVRDIKVGPDGRRRGARRAHRRRVPAAQRDHQPRDRCGAGPARRRRRRPRLHRHDRPGARGPARAPPRRSRRLGRPRSAPTVTPRAARSPSPSTARAPGRCSSPPARAASARRSVTTNLAVALAQQGHSVGVIDADVYGFSIPRMLGTDRDPVVIDNMLLPPEQWGVRCISIAYFVPEGQAVIWRGPMLHKALEQFLTDVYWDEPDFLLVDMPPGTGDIALSLSQFLPRGEVYVVTTPQPAAQKVARLSAAMAERVNLEVKGVIENMSWFTGDDGKRYEIFGAGGGQELADELGVPLLGQIPLLPQLREGGDDGRPDRRGGPGQRGRPASSRPSPSASPWSWRRGASTAPPSRSSDDRPAVAGVRVARAPVAPLTLDRRSARARKRSADVDVRIGVIQAPREILLEMGGDTDRDALKAQVDAALSSDGGVLWLTDERGREVGHPVGEGRLRRDRHPRRRPPDRLRRADAPRADDGRSDPARPQAPVRHRQGRRRQDHRRRVARRCSRRRQGKRTLVCEVDAKGDLAAAYESRPLTLQAPRGAARPVRHGDEHRGLAARSTSASSCGSRCSAASVRWPARLDFVANAAPGREGDPHGRQGRPTRCGSATTTSSSSTPRRRGHIIGQLAAPKAINELVQVGHGPRPDAVDARHPPRPRPHGRAHRDDPRGDAGHRDHRAGRTPRRARPASTWPPSS